MTMSAGREQEPSADAPTFLVASTVFGQRFEERYFRQPVPLHFPVEEEMPETKRHLELRTLLYQVLKLAFADRAAIGCDQFVYWDPTDPRACLAPDGFVRLGEPDHLFDTWMVWEHGAPQVAIEIGSRSDRPEPRWEDKLEKYRRLGVVELIRFEPEAAQRPLRIWDSVDRELVERALIGVGARSRVLPGFWMLVETPELGRCLRLAHDERGEQLYPTPAEHEAEARRAEAEARQAEVEARRVEAEAATARVRELAALLAEHRQ